MRTSLLFSSLVLSGCIGTIPTMYQQPDGSFSGSQPNYSANLQLNFITVTNASSVRLCEVFLVDAKGNMSPSASDPIMPGVDGQVMLPAGLDYNKPQDRPTIAAAAYTLRAFTCQDRDSSERGTLFREVKGVTYFGDKPVLH